MAPTFIDADADDRGAIGIGAAVSIVLHLLLVAVLITWVHGTSGMRGGHDKQKQMLINLEIMKPPEPPKVVPPKPKPEVKPQPKVIAKPTPQVITTQAPVSAPVPTVPPPPAKVETKSEPAPAKVVGYEIPSAYKSLLQTQIQSSLVYPKRALMNEEQGSVRVRVSMTRDGHILSVTVVTSSGSKSLDEEAQKVFSRIGQLPALPANYDAESTQFTFELPIAFALQQEN